MKHPFLPTRLQLFLLALLLSTLNYPRSTFGQGSAFTYQGQLKQNGAPANGDYALRFTLYDALTGGGAVAGPITNAATVSNGLFTATLDFGPGVFNGGDRWLEIGVTNGNGNFSTLAPRQKITPAPYAILAQTVSTNGLAPGSYTNAVTLNNAANQFTGAFAGNGANMTNVNAAALDGFSANAFWQLNGNAGSTPGANFLGTADNLSLEFKVNGTRALRLEPNPNAPNVLGGSAANEVTNGIYGAVIAGGGSSVYPNRVGAIFGTVAGGAANTASGNFSTAMGQFNTASGYASTAMGYSTVAGGFGSLAGGTTAKANHDGAFVWADNNFLDFASSAPNQFLIRAGGGVGINTNNPNGAALAVNGNVTVNNAIGTGNQPLELKVNGTRALRLEPTSFGTPNIIGGSPYNSVFPGAVGVTIAGGGSASASNTVNFHGAFATIGGGSGNTCDGSGSTVAGGQNNTSTAMSGATVAGGSGNTSSDNNATVGGGSGNTSSSRAATVSGGSGNMSGGQYATVAGGSQNSSSGQYATVGGGSVNTSSGQYATAPGGDHNLAAGNYSFAAGQQAKANHSGSFVWADAQFADFNSTGGNQFLVRAAGGVGINKNNPGATLDVNGSLVATTITAGNLSVPSGTLSFGSQTRQMLNLWGTQYGMGVQSYTLYFRTDSSFPGGGFAWYQGGTHDDGKTNSGGGATLMTLDAAGLRVNGTLVSSSDRHVKAGFTPVDGQEILQKVAALPITRWHYTNDAATPHLGPMAQDFHAAFGIGPDDKHIATVDESGIALAAIQGLNQKLEQKETKIAELEQRLEKLERLMEAQK